MNDDAMATREDAKDLLNWLLRGVEKPNEPFPAYIWAIIHDFPEFEGLIKATADKCARMGNEQERRKIKGRNPHRRGNGWHGKNRQTPSNGE
jgi:hypothetical protein